MIARVFRPMCDDMYALCAPNKGEVYEAAYDGLATEEQAREAEEWAGSANVGDKFQGDCFSIEMLIGEKIW